LTYVSNHSFCAFWSLKLLWSLPNWNLRVAEINFFITNFRFFAVGIRTSEAHFVSWYPNVGVHVVTDKLRIGIASE
jgi:hypothetical protein